MAGLSETPCANRVHIAFFGLRNAGKSTLVNAFTGQPLAIVSETPGTTTDPVSKAMEILPLGPCLVTDTAGLDDVGDLGAQRIAKSLDVLATTDVAVWVWALGGPGSCPALGGPGSCPAEREAVTQERDPPEGLYARFLEECRRRRVTVLEYRRGDSVDALKAKIAALKLVDDTPGLLDGLVVRGDRVVCVCPIDGSAPKGRLILPQVQLVRDCLDRHVACAVCQPEELSEILESLDSAFQISDHRSSGLDSGRRVLVVTDSQAFASVRQTIRTFKPQTSNLKLQTFSLTSFSILFARQKGDLDAYMRGLGALKTLRDGDTVLVAEGCTHRRQCNDIGTVKIPKALKKLTGRELNFVFASGGGFLETPPFTSTSRLPSPPSLIVQCGGCMLTRREVLRRIALAREAGIPIVNYGMVLAAANGIEVIPGTCLVRP